jgi:hypothetical protein
MTRPAHYAGPFLLLLGLCGVLHAAEEPAFSAEASRLVGIYEALPADEPLPAGLSPTPPSLDPLHVTPAAAQAQATAAAGPDPKSACQVLGPFRYMARPDVKFEILRDAPNKLVVLFQNESWGHLRTISIDAAHDPALAKARPLWNGDSVAVWKGDTLEIDSTHFTNKTWLNDAAIVNSKQLHLTERLRLIDGGKYLEYRVTAVDPEVLTEPASYTRYFKRTTREIVEDTCVPQRPAGQ